MPPDCALRFQKLSRKAHQSKATLVSTHSLIPDVPYDTDHVGEGLGCPCDVRRNVHKRRVRVFVVELFRVIWRNVVERHVVAAGHHGVHCDTRLKQIIRL